ncbi:MAG TPA: NAD(P)-binding domain-containing protein, partial [Vicinamibacterales bacterium]
TYKLEIAYEEKVISVQRETGEQLFAVTTESSRGVQRVRHARNLVMAIGYYDHPVLLGIPGEDLPHVHHYYGEAHAHYRQRVIVVGGGNSAAEAALELYRAGAQVTVVHRRAALKRTIKYWVRPDIENRIKAGSIAARLGAQLVEIRQDAVSVQAVPDASAADDETARQRELFADADASAAPASAVVAPATHTRSIEEIPADAVYLLTGYRTDAKLLVAAGVQLNQRDAPVHNPQTFETNVSGLFVAGGAIAGQDTGTVFIENGRFHGQKIIDVIAGRLE